MGAFASEIRSHVSTDAGDQVALTLNVGDMAGLQAFLRSETCDAIMRRHGVIRPVNVFSD